jgi:hypothetical protein
VGNSGVANTEAAQYLFDLGYPVPLFLRGLCMEGEEGLLYSKKRVTTGRHWGCIQQSGVAVPDGWWITLALSARVMRKESSSSTMVLRKNCKPSRWGESEKGLAGREQERGR